MLVELAMSSCGGEAGSVWREELGFTRRVFSSLERIRILSLQSLKEIVACRMMCVVSVPIARVDPGCNLCAFCNHILELSLGLVVLVTVTAVGILALHS